MEKIIKGLLYNTDTSELIGNYSYGTLRDFYYIDEDLYKTKKGKFFLAGEGGALSKYRTYIADNEWTGGSNIIPLSINEAKEWAERYLDLGPDEYTYFFGELGEA